MTPSVIKIELEEKISEAVLQGISACMSTRRCNVERDALAMAEQGAQVLAKCLSAVDLDRLRQFRAIQAAVLHVASPSGTVLEAPPTPVRGFSNDVEVQAYDVFLLAVMLICGIIPVSFVFENDWRLFRNVVANPESKRLKSSHGSDEPLGWHIDNPCGRFEQLLSPWTLESIIPRFLAFFCVRNRDACGEAVSTDVLLLEPALRYCNSEAVGILTTNDFQVNPPASNTCRPLIGVPLIEVVDGSMLFRFNANPVQVFGLTERSRWALKEFTLALEAASADSLSFALTPGSILLFDNYKVAHARRSFDPGENPAESRWLRRCYGLTSTCTGRHIDRASWPHVIA